MGNWCGCGHQYSMRGCVLDSDKFAAAPYPPQSPYRFTSASSIIDENNILIRPREYKQIRPGHFALDSEEPFADETIPLTNSEIKQVVIPMFEILREEASISIDDIIKCCSDDLLHRVVRGKMNKSPNDEKWTALLNSTSYRINPHVAAAAEALETIIEWRLKEEVLANDLLTNHLHDVEVFHQLWPCYRSAGCDAHGHVIVCEEVRHVNSTELMDNFTLEEVILLRMQVLEQVLFAVQSEGRRRGFLLSQHIHLVNLEGVSISK
jgi:hypothetical protein